MFPYEVSLQCRMVALDSREMLMHAAGADVSGAVGGAFGAGQAGGGAHGGIIEPSVPSHF